MTFAPVALLKRAKKVIRSFKRANHSFALKKQAIRTKNQRAKSQTCNFACCYSFQFFTQPDFEFYALCDIRVSPLSLFLSEAVNGTQQQRLLHILLDMFGRFIITVYDLHKMQLLSVTKMVENCRQFSHKEQSISVITNSLKHRVYYSPILPCSKN